MIRLNLRSLLESYKVSLFACVIICVFIVDISSAEIDYTAHWSVEVTEKWNAVYGQITGISLEEGDSVGMFNAKGDCYGAGLIRGGYYFLSAFMLEQRDTEKGEDFTISGFKDGDVVIFKAYKESTNEEYVLVPGSGEQYVFAYKGSYPPIRIDLFYGESASIQPSEPKKEEPTPASQEDTASHRIYPGSVKGLTETDEGEKEGLGKTKELAESAEKTEQKTADIKATGKDGKSAIIFDESREPSQEDAYREYKPADYEEGGRLSALNKPSTREVQPTSGDASDSRYSRQEQDKETAAVKETVLAKARESEPAAIKEKSIVEKRAKRKSPFVFIILLICASAVLIMGLFKKFKKK